MNSTSLFNRLAIIGKELLDENLLDIYNGNIKPVMQDELKNYY